MNKQLWLTSLAPDRAIPSAVSAKLRPYGFDVAGSIWNDDIERMGWQEPLQMLVNPSLAGWLILTTPEELFKPTVRYGLSLLAISVAASRRSLPTFIISCAGAPPAVSELPSPFLTSIPIAITEPALCARIVANTSVPSVPGSSDYRIDIIGDQQVGQWFEISAAKGSWNGGLLGVCGGEINFQAVGPSGALPKDTVLNYPVRGMRLATGDSEFIAWGVQNGLPEGTSCFTRVKGMPAAIMFGQFPEGDEPELYTLKLI